MSLLDVFKLLNSSHQNQGLIAELQNSGLESIAEFGQSNDYKFNESELIFATAYLQLQKIENQSNSDRNNSLITLVRNISNAEEISNQQTIIKMKDNCCKKRKHKCPNMEDVIIRIDIVTQALYSNNMPFFSSFIQDESENILEDSIWLRKPSGGYAYRNPVLINPEPSSETEIEIKWNICKEIIIEVLQEEE